MPVARVATPTATRPIGVARKTGRKSAGFIDSVLGVRNEFYGNVVQNSRRGPRKHLRSVAQFHSCETFPGRVVTQRAL